MRGPVTVNDLRALMGALAYLFAKRLAEMPLGGERNRDAERGFDHVQAGLEAIDAAERAGGERRIGAHRIGVDHGELVFNVGPRRDDDGDLAGQGGLVFQPVGV